MFRNAHKFFVLVIFILNGFLFSPFTPKYVITSEEPTPEADSSHHEQDKLSNFRTVTSRGINTTSHSYIEEFENDVYRDHLATNASGWGQGRIELGIELGTPIYRDMTGIARDVYVSGDYAYIADESHGLAIINISV